MPNAPLTHRKVGNAQVGLSYFFLAGFFLCLILEGFGYLKTNVTNNLREVLMLVMSFWFMRQRESGAEYGSQPPALSPSPESKPQNPTRPPLAAAGLIPNA